MDSLFEERCVLDLDGMEVHLIHVGPCHQVGRHRRARAQGRGGFAGDVIFRKCTPIGWTGTCEQRLKAIALIIGLDRKSSFPDTDRCAGSRGQWDMNAYLEYVREESKH